MNNLKFKKVKCPICNFKSFHRFIQKPRVSYFPTKIGIFNLKSFDVICKKCSFVYSNPKPTSGSLKRFYSNKFLNNSLYPDYDVKKQINFFCKNAEKKHEILEIGSSNDFLINLLKKKGFKACGFDFLTGKEFKKKKFDFILLNHTLEHISEPKIFLNDLKSYLKEDGKLIIEVPDLKQYENDDTILTAEHITHFTEETLRKLLHNCSFVCTKKEKKNLSRKYSIRLIFKKTNLIEKYQIDKSEFNNSKKIYTKAIKINNKRIENFIKVSKKINLLKNTNIYFWGCNSIFINIYSNLKNDIKKKINLVDENSKKIKYLQVAKRKKILIQNPQDIFLRDLSNIKFVICAISWKQSIQKKILRMGVLKKKILIPKI